MAVPGFHAEWRTIGDHRVYLHHRASFPCPESRRVVGAAVRAVRQWLSRSARVTEVFYDDKSSTYGVSVATDKPEDERPGDYIDNIEEACRAAAGGTWCSVNVLVVPAARHRQSDHYNHMEYLSESAGVACDRSGGAVKKTKEGTNGQNNN
jgi:hypothetical protein